MRNIWRIFTRDLRNLRHNVIGLIVVVGLIVVPPLYAWFNIAGGWDPYGNTGGMKVAVANADEGYKSDLIPIEVNLGDTVISQLRANDQLDWQFVDEDEAIEGVKSGAYYAAVVIPKDFSADMMTLFSTEVKHSKIIYYENQKKSAVAPEVTSQGASTIQARVDETFAKTIGDVGLSAASGLMDFMDSDQVANYVANLSGTLDAGASSLEDAAGSMGSFGTLLGSTSSLVSSTSSLMQDTGGTSAEASKALADAKSGFKDIESAIAGSTGVVNDALKQSASSYDSVSSAIDQAYQVGAKQAEDSAGDLEAISGDVNAQTSVYQDMRKVLVDIQSLFKSNLDALQGKLPSDSTILKIATDNYMSVSAAIDNMDKLIARNQALSKKLTDTAAALRTGSTNVATDIQAAKDLVAQAKASVTSVQSDYETKLKSQTDQLKSSVSDITSSTSGISESLDKTVDDLSAASGSLAKDLSDVQGVLQNASGSLTDAAGKLRQLETDLNTAAQAGDLDKVRSLIGSDPAALASALSSPVTVDEQAIYPMANNGSAMAPFYTTLSLWVGAIVLAAMCKVDLGEAAIRELAPVRLHELYLGRFCFFALMSLCQSTLVCAGDILFFGIQAVNPLQVFGACWVAGLVFCCIVYTLAVSFGDIGKALSVVLLVMQVAASGGEFPIEMYDPIFQTIYPFLPFVHAMNAMRAGMAGAFGMEYWTELGTLALYLLPALALGLLLRRPVIRANQWIIRKLEDTKLM